MAVVTLKQFLKKDFLEKTVRNSAAVASQADLVIKRRVAGLKGVALKEFDRHPVSREIAQGPEGVNVSNTLSGEGNLFSFIGFSKTSDPLGPVREVLKSNLNLTSRQKKKVLLSQKEITKHNELNMHFWKSNAAWQNLQEMVLKFFLRVRESMKTATVLVKFWGYHWKKLLWF